MYYAGSNPLTSEYLGESIVSLYEKITSLTPEQRAQFDGLKTTGQIGDFISGISMELSEEEKERALTFIKTGALPLDDEELVNVTGRGD